MKLAISRTGLLLLAAMAAVGGQGAYALAYQAPASPPPAQEPAPASQDDKDAIILDRQLVMQDLDKQSEALGNIAAGLKPPADMLAHAQAIAKDAKEAQKSFLAKVPGGGSKPEVWTNWDDFSKRMQDFVTKTDAMAKVAETGDLNKVGESMIDALQCKQCHDLYRITKP